MSIPGTGIKRKLSALLSVFAVMPMLAVLAGYTTSAQSSVLDLSFSTKQAGSVSTGTAVDRAVLTGEQATGVAEANKAANQIDRFTRQNAAMVEESRAAGHSLAKQAEELGRLIVRFSIGPGANVVRLERTPPSTKPQRTMTALEAPGRRGASALCKAGPEGQAGEEF